MVKKRKINSVEDIGGLVMKLTPLIKLRVGY